MLTRLLAFAFSGAGYGLFYGSGWPGLARLVPQGRESQYVGLLQGLSFLPRLVPVAIFQYLAKSNSDLRLAFGHLCIYMIPGIFLLLSVDFDRGGKKAGRLSAYAQSDTLETPANIRKRRKIAGGVGQSSELRRAGFVKLSQNMEECNRINVFPIPDGDTGTNMVISLRPAIIALGAEPKSDLLSTLRTIQAHVTLNAQGNSGTLFSFFFSKLFAAAKAHSDPAELSVKDFASCFKAVSAQMNSAMGDKNQ